MHCLLETCYICYIKKSWGNRFKALLYCFCEAKFRKPWLREAQQLLRFAQPWFLFGKQLFPFAPQGHQKPWLREAQQLLRFAQPWLPPKDCFIYPLGHQWQSCASRVHALLCSQACLRNFFLCFFFLFLFGFF